MNPEYDLPIIAANRDPNMEEVSKNNYNAVNRAICYVGGCVSDACLTIGCCVADADFASASTRLCLAGFSARRGLPCNDADATSTSSPSKYFACCTSDGGEAIGDTNSETG